MGTTAVISWRMRKAPTWDSGAERRSCRDFCRRFGRKREARFRTRDMRLVFAFAFAFAFAFVAVGLEEPEPVGGLASLD